MGLEPKKMGGSGWAAAAWQGGVKVKATVKVRRRCQVDEDGVRIILLVMWYMGCS